MLRNCCFVVACLFGAGCSSRSVLDKALPPVTPTGGAQTVFAGAITPENFEAERVRGPASQGRPGDFYLRNDKIRAVLQAPGTNVGPCPFGGNVIDLDRVADPAGDQLGEISPFFQLGRTFNFERGEIVADGSRGGPAAVRFYGHDAKIDYIDLPNIGGFTQIIPQEYRAKVPLGLEAAVTYVLHPGETKLQAIYTIYNASKIDVATTWGTLADTGASIEVFHPYSGYGEIGFDSILNATDAPPGNYVALQGQGITYGVMPRFSDLAIGGAGIAVAGVNVEVFDIKAIIDAFNSDGQTLVIPVGKVETRELAIFVAPDVAGVTASVHALRGEATQAFLGSVRDADGVPVGGARVVVSDPSKPATSALVTTLTTKSDGTFAGALPAGSYELTAEGDNFRRGTATAMTLPLPSGGAPVALALPAAALLRYTVKGRDGAGIAAKISVIGARASAPDRRFRDVGADSLPQGIAGYRFSLVGDSGANNDYDAPIALAPGRYRVVVTKGPEWSRISQVIDLGPGGAQIDAVLDRIVPTPGYVAADFHQHSYYSPDASVSPESKAVAYLAEGVEFLSSSEHDTHYDYEPLLDQLGVGNQLDSIVGVETTPWDYGHFIGFPMAFDPDSPTGGALDWSGGEGNPALPPAQIFSQMRVLGAKVVQVNHPRAGRDAFSTFQNNFDRAGLRFDFAARTFYGDFSIAEFDAKTLGLPDDAALFGANFDAIEIFNGFGAGAADAAGERPDIKVETNLRDWMNFLSFGFTPTPEGNSDSHSLYSAPCGLPRTMVRVPDDSSSAIAAGLGEAVVATIAGAGKPRDVVVTNTPFLQFTVDGMGIGTTVAHPAGGPLQLHVEVKTPAWAPIDTVEIFANETFEIPSDTDAPLAPALCFTTRAAPSSRCASAIGGARPLVLTTVEAVPGDPNTARLEAVVDLPIEAAALLARQRQGAQGQDLWLVARTFGDVGLYPLITAGGLGGKSVSDVVETFDLRGVGQPALAFTNAIFVDVDGGGWRAPFAP